MSKARGTAALDRSIEEVDRISSSITSSSRSSSLRA